MAAIKALLIAGLGTFGIFLLIVWIIPLLTFLVIFAGISLISYAIIIEDKQLQRPPD